LRSAQAVSRPFSRDPAFQIALFAVLAVFGLSVPSARRSAKACSSADRSQRQKRISTPAYNDYQKRWPRAPGPDLPAPLWFGCGFQTRRCMSKGRKLLAGATNRTHWRSLFMPLRSIQQCRPHSRRSPGCASSTARRIQWARPVLPHGGRQAGKRSTPSARRP